MFELRFPAARPSPQRVCFGWGRRPLDVRVTRYDALCENEAEIEKRHGAFLKRSSQSTLNSWCCLFSQLISNGCFVHRAAGIEVVKLKWINANSRNRPSTKANELTNFSVLFMTSCATWGWFVARFWCLYTPKYFGRLHFGKRVVHHFDIFFERYVCTCSIVLHERHKGGCSIFIKLTVWYFAVVILWMRSLTVTTETYDLRTVASAKKMKLRSVPKMCIT